MGAVVELHDAPPEERMASIASAKNERRLVFSNIGFPS